MENELHPELLGIHGTNFTIGNDSSSRGQMYSSHISQSLVVKGSTEKRIQTGMEMRLGEYTFAIKAPCDMRVIKIIERYPKKMGYGGIPENPESLVIYENIHTLEVGCIFIPRFLSHHQHFGFEYIMQPAFYKLAPNVTFPKDTVFADSPSKSENDGYKYGIELNIALMTHPVVAEDGIMISEDVLDRLSFKVYERRVVSFGTESFPLNLYGNTTQYKPFPEIGDHIRDDGILVILRNYDNDICPVDMGIYDVTEPDYVFDKPVYVRGPGGKVIDIKVYHGQNDNSPTPSGIMDNIDKYAIALKDYYRNILDTYHQIRSYRKKKFNDVNHRLKLEPDFHRLVVEAMAMLSDQNVRSQQKLNLVYKKEPLDDYRVEFVIEYEIVPTIGFKMSGSHGDKGVICAIEKPENMPVDADGNRADVVMDSGSTINRMNIGRLYEQYFGSTLRDVAKTVRRILGAFPLQQRLDYVSEGSITYNQTKTTIENINRDNPHLIQSAFVTLLELYQIVSEKQYQFYRQCGLDDIIEHLTYVVLNGIYVYYPTNNEKEISELVLILENKYRPTYGPVTYVGNSGQRVKTYEPVRIGPVHMLLLDKIADSLSSVSSGVLQHFGILSPIIRAEKYSYPHRNSPVRTIGETEGRLLAAYCGREAIAEMLDMSNSPTTHRYIVKKILSADKPTNIDRVVDRNLIPLGGSKSLQIVSHIALAAGWRFVYKPDSYIKLLNSHETNTRTLPTEHS